jgi:hypothetical protein
MCNTGIRPSEAKILRWRDITTGVDCDTRELVVLFVRGKGKSRKLVAPKSAGDYLDRIRAIAKATGPDDPVFTAVTGKPAKSRYQSMIEGLLQTTQLQNGPCGKPRSTYCFWDTHATFRLGEGVGVYFIAEQMGTSVKMIEEHYGHVNTVKHAGRVLQGMGGWNPIPIEAEDGAVAAGDTATPAEPGAWHPSRPLSPAADRAGRSPPVRSPGLWPQAQDAPPVRSTEESCGSPRESCAMRHPQDESTSAASSVAIRASQISRTSACSCSICACIQASSSAVTLYWRE